MERQARHSAQSDPGVVTNTGSSLLRYYQQINGLVALVAGVPVPPPVSVTVMLKLSLDVSLPLWLYVKARLALVMIWLTVTGAVVLEGAVGEAATYSDGLAGVVWSVTTTLPRSPPITGTVPPPKAHILLALDHDDAAGRIGHLIDRREGSMVIVWLATRPPAPSSTVRTMLSVSPLATLVTVVRKEIGDIAERNGGTDRQLIAAQFEHAFGRSPARRYLDDDLVGAVVRVRQSQIHLTHRATSHATTRGCNEKDTATFCCTQPIWGTNAGRTHRGASF